MARSVWYLIKPGGFLNKINTSLLGFYLSWWVTESPSPSNTSLCQHQLIQSEHVGRPQSAKPHPRTPHQEPKLPPWAPSSKVI